MLHLSVCLFLASSVCLSCFASSVCFFYSSVCFLLHLSVCLFFIHLSACYFICLFVCFFLFICLFFYSSVSLSVFCFICLFVCFLLHLSLCLSISFPTATTKTWFHSITYARMNLISTLSLSRSQEDGWRSAGDFLVKWEPSGEEIS